MQSTHVTGEIQGEDIMNQVLLRLLCEATGMRGVDDVSKADFKAWYHR